jgi:hypothetical protein
MDILEQERNYFRARAFPQISNLGSNNRNTRNTQAGQSGVEQEGQEVEPMDTEDNAQSHDGMQDEPTNNIAN